MFEQNTTDYMMGLFAYFILKTPIIYIMITLISKGQENKTIICINITYIKKVLKYFKI